MNKTYLFLAAAAATFAMGASSSAAVLNKSYSYFTIGGSTLDEIQDEIAKHGPHIQSTGARHPGATRMEFKSRTGYEQTERGCRISSATVTVKAKVILPRWNPPAKADGDVRFIWATLSSDIKRHEESHVIIAKNHGRLLEKELLGIGRQKNCDIVAEKAKAVTQKVLAQHDREQRYFDMVETKNFESRLLRLLKYRLQQAAASQKKGEKRTD